MTNTGAGVATAACRAAGKAGFTIPEVLIASGMGLLVTATVMTCFIWCAQQATLCSKIAWSQKEAILTSGKLTDYMRNAAEVVEMDEDKGGWVRLRFPDGSIGRLVYSNSASELRDGRLLLQRTNGTEVIVARGLTKIMNEQGYPTPVFRKTRDNALFVAYRIVEPVATGTRISEDGAYAASIRFGACLRNVEE